MAVPSQLEFSHNKTKRIKISKQKKTDFQTYHILEHHMPPGVHLDPLYSTRLLATTIDQGCGNSSLQLHDYRQKMYYLCKMVLAREVYSMTIAGTGVRSLSY